MKRKILSLITFFGCIFGGLKNIESCAFDGNKTLVEKIEKNIKKCLKDENLEALTFSLENMLIKYIDSIDISIPTSDSDFDRVGLSFGQFIGDTINRTTSIDVKSPHWKSSIKFAFREFIIDNISDVIRRALTYQEMSKYEHIILTGEQKTRGKIATMLMSMIGPWLNDDNFFSMLDKITEKPLIILQHRIEELLNKSKAMNMSLDNRNLKIKNSIHVNENK